MWLKIFFLACLVNNTCRLFVKCHPKVVNYYPFEPDAVNGGAFVDGGENDYNDYFNNEIDSNQPRFQNYGDDENYSYSSPEESHEDKRPIITYGMNELGDDKEHIITYGMNELDVDKKPIITYGMNEFSDFRDETGPQGKKPIITYGVHELFDVGSRTRAGENSRGLSSIVLTEEPIECKYNTPEFPIPKMKIIKRGRRVSDIKCQEYSWRFQHEIIDMIYYKRECDIKMITSGIADGENSEKGEFSHMGALYWKRKGDDPVPLCGSSLISPKFALTAAHCAQASKELIKQYHLLRSEPSYIRFGAINLNKRFEHALDVNIKKIMKYDGYKPVYNYNDIALIQLANEVPMSYHIRPACLWDGNLGDHKTGNITGWGRIYDYDPNSSQEHLQYAEVDFIDSKECSSIMKLNHNRDIIRSQFCAGLQEGGKDTCQGDSGGPIQVQEIVGDHGAIIYHVVGVTSFGANCGEPESPSIYTNVTSFLCWIEKRVWPEERNSKC